MEQVQTIDDNQIVGHSELLTNNISNIPTDRPLRLQEIARFVPDRDVVYLSGLVHIEIDGETLQKLNNATTEYKELVRAAIIAQARVSFEKMIDIWKGMSL